MTIGAVPPPEKVTGYAAAAGEYVPSEFCASVVFSGTQDPFTKALTGVVDVDMVKVPSGFADTLVVSVVSPATGTDVPLSYALTAADSSLWDSPAPSTGGFAAFVAWVVWPFEAFGLGVGRETVGFGAAEAPDAVDGCGLDVCVACGDSAAPALVVDALAGSGFAVTAAAMTTAIAAL